MGTKPQVVQFGKVQFGDKPPTNPEVQFGKHPAASKPADAGTGIVPSYAGGDAVPHAHADEH
jgi:hypothetical protein